MLPETITKPVADGYTQHCGLRATSPGHCCAYRPISLDSGPKICEHRIMGEITVVLGGWRVRESMRGRRHVTPRRDLRVHDAENCWCQPEDDGYLIVHNSADGREDYESGKRKRH